MILIDPFLLITLHFSHIGFTEDLTFIPSSFHRNLVTKQLLNISTQDGKMQALFI